MAFQTRKVAIIGAGHVGSHCALSLITMGECDELVMIDTDKPKALAQATDLADAAAYLPHHIRVTSGDYTACRDADIVVVCTGPRPRSGQPRADMLAQAVGVMKQIVGPVVDSGFDGIFLVLSNPCDVLAYYLQKMSGFPAGRVLATGTALDSARLRRILSRSLMVDSKSIHAYVMGEHGESQMVPWSNISVGGKPLLELMAENPDSFGRIDLTAVAALTRRCGMTVLDGKGCTEFGVGITAAEIIKTIYHDERKILPVSVLLEGQYGQKDVYAGVPAIIGRDGVSGIVEIRMSDAERADFAASCQALRNAYEAAMAF